jgi:hypothetical protein
MDQPDEKPQKRTRAKSGEPKKPRTWVNKIKASKTKERFDQKTVKEQARERVREARKQAIIEALERSGKELKPYQNIGLKTGSYVFDLDRQTRFCEEFAKHGRKKQSADVAGVSIATIQRYLSADPIFKDMFAEAQATYRDHVAEEVYRRGVTGIEKPIIGGQFRDEIICYEKVYSDRLLELEAKRVDPGYRDRGNIDIAVKEGGVLVIANNKTSLDDWENKFKGTTKEEPIVIDVTSE